MIAGMRLYDGIGLPKPVSQLGARIIRNGLKSSCVALKNVKGLNSPVGNLVALWGECGCFCFYVKWVDFSPRKFQYVLFDKELTWMPMRE